MKFIHDRNSNTLFSLHDSRVKAITYYNETLTLQVNKIYEFVEGKERSYPGEICFEKCDIDLCDVLIFNKTLGEGRFNGKSIGLQQFIDEYTDSEFEENLPMEKKLFYELFDYLNDKSETVECNHDFSLTNEFLKDKNADIEKVIEFLRENGAGCDCEVIFNVEEKFEE